MLMLPALLEKITNPLLRYFIEKLHAAEGRFGLNLPIAQLKRLQSIVPVNASATTVKELLLLELVAMGEIQVSQAAAFQQQLDAIIVDDKMLPILSVDEQYQQFIQQDDIPPTLRTFFAQPAISAALRTSCQQFSAAWPTMMHIYQVSMHKATNLLDAFPNEWHATLQPIFKDFDKKILTQLAVEYGKNNKTEIASRDIAKEQLAKYPEKLLKAAVQKRGFKHFCKQDSHQREFSFDAAKQVLINYLATKKWHVVDSVNELTKSTEQTILEINISNLTFQAIDSHHQVSVPGAAIAGFKATANGWQLDYLAATTSALKKCLQNEEVDFQELAKAIPHAAEKSRWLAERSMTLDAEKTLLEWSENATDYPDTKGFFTHYKLLHAAYLKTFDLDQDGDASRVQDALILAHCDLMLDFNAWLHQATNNKTYQRNTKFLTNNDCSQLVQNFKNEFALQAKQALQSPEPLKLDSFRYDYDRSVGDNNVWLFYQEKKQIDTSVLFPEELFHNLAYDLAIKKCIVLLMNQKNFNWLFTETVERILCSQLDNALRFGLSDRQTFITFLTLTQFEIVCRFETFLIAPRQEAEIFGETSWCPRRENLSPASIKIKLLVDCVDYHNPQVDVFVEIATTLVTQGMERLLAYPKKIGLEVDRHPDRKAILQAIGEHPLPINDISLAEILEKFPVPLWQQTVIYQESPVEYDQATLKNCQKTTDYSFRRCLREFIRGGRWQGDSFITHLKLNGQFLILNFTAVEAEKLKLANENLAFAMTGIVAGNRYDERANAEFAELQIQCVQQAKAFFHAALPTASEKLLTYFVAYYGQEMGFSTFYVQYLHNHGILIKDITEREIGRAHV